MIESVDPKDVHTKKTSKYKEEFYDGLYKWVSKVLETKKEAVFKEKDVRKWLHVRQSTTIDSIYRRMREILLHTDMGVKIGTHVDGDRVLVFYWREF